MKRILYLTFIFYIAQIVARDIEKEERTVEFGHFKDCKGSKNAAIDFSGVSVAGDKQSTQGTVVVKKEYKNPKVTITGYIIKNGKKEYLETSTIDFCKAAPNYPDYLYYGVLKQGLGTSCPIKKGKKKINIPVSNDKLDDNITVGVEVEFDDKSCFEFDSVPKNK